MDSTLPLYRQFTRRLFILASSFILFLVAAVTLYYHGQQDLLALKKQQFPAIAKQMQQQQLLHKHQQLLNEMLTSGNAEQFAMQQQMLEANLLDLIASSEQSRAVLEPLLRRLQRQTENALRLAASSRRNIQLKESVLIQLTLVVDSVKTLVSQQITQQNQLYRDLTQGNLSSQSKSNRAIKLSELTMRLAENRQLLNTLTASLVMFQQLDLHYDLIEFEYLQQQSQQALSRWLDPDTAPLSSKPKVLLEQTKVLNNLLFSEQNTFAKWRGQLRRFDAYRAELTAQQTELTPLIEQVMVREVATYIPFNQQLANELVKFKLDIQPKHITWLALALLVLLLISFFAALISVRRKLKRYGQQSYVLVDELITQGKVIHPIPSAEMADIITAIKKLARPEFSEAAFKKQQQKQQQMAEMMTRHSGHVFWVLPLTSKRKRQQILQLLGSKDTQLHWRHCFCRADVRAILRAARSAKKKQQRETLTLLSKYEKPIILSVEYYHNVWCGSLADATKWQALTAENEQLTLQLQQLAQAHVDTNIRISNVASKQLAEIMVQQQLHSLSAQNEQVIYQLLQQLQHWHQQQAIAAQLRSDDFVLTLAKVNFSNELHCALLTAGKAQQANKNTLYLNAADQVATWVTLDSRLFQTMLVSICERLLAGQQGAELEINVRLVDVNSAQQIIRMSFAVSNASCWQSLTQTSNELAADADINPEYSENQSDYLKDLQLIFNLGNKAHQQLEEAAKFSFELPLALAEALADDKQMPAVTLSQRNILVIATDSGSRQRLCQHLAVSQAEVETMHDVTLFRRQLSLKHLSKYPLDVIVLSPEVYRSDFALINDHLASLPASVQPKLLVIQPHYQCNFAQWGLYAESQSPWLGEQLVLGISSLLASNKSSNLLIAPEIFKPYQYVKSQVEVLLAVADIKKHQLLVRLLQWFGLQVKVSSEPASLQRQWRTGQFLVMISEWLPTELTINQALTPRRGVFLLTDKVENQQSLAVNAIPNEWHSGHLAPILDIQQLSKQLAPWLKHGTENAQSANNKQHLAAISHQVDAKREDLNEKIVATETYNNQDAPLQPLDQALDFSLPLSADYIDAAQAFDLARFAQNQGSAELAAYMLDDYLANIQQHTLALEQAIEQVRYPEALTQLEKLQHLANLLVAETLCEQCQSLRLLVESLAKQKEAALPAKQQLQPALNHFTLCVKQLTEFVESI
ncbi:hypothetical protein SAMN05216262_12331 [Colwellia chukchiensis]|uniref:Uncharacterized protein n=1 Tax=Colwellia chukchiensis TaxID=641665 RepID=A0A1H7T861_9GAMM|nr:hypothetical protein [Colwellia chukchiensis]SEL80898.1 hypothetical protein SAMN05216262_12331 [Colwellia chukchiensis]